MAGPRLVPALAAGCIITLFCAALLGFTFFPGECCECEKAQNSGHSPRAPLKSAHRLALIIPFRDRFDELLQFVPHMTKFLRRQNVDFRIFVMNQADRYRFNRASLINAGYLLSGDEYDYIAMHDVDLLPLNPKLDYSYPKEGPFHIASPEFHPKYNYSTFVGGILLIRKDHFELVDGMSNKYWGWGLEDDEFYVRLKEAKLKITRPANITTNRSNTFSHIHDRVHRRRDTTKCYNQYEATRRRDRETGLHNVDFEKLNEQILTIDGLEVTVVNINLSCDKDLTPWCDCTQEIAKMKNNNKKKPLSKA